MTCRAAVLAPFSLQGGEAGASCINPSDAAYWARTAMNMNLNSGIDFVAAANGYYRNFNLVAFYVRSGTVKVKEAS